MESGHDEPEASQRLEEIENLIMGAQDSRVEGDMDSSIAMLRMALNQCNKELRNSDGCPTSRAVVLRMRQMGAYQLAMLLLQRDGRRARVEDEGDSATSTEETEADLILRRLGYRLRLSKLALGYIQRTGKRVGPLRASNRPPSAVQVVDGAMPSQLFQSLQHALRPKSKYWSHFYSKAENQFASHNISLVNDRASSVEQRLKNSKSLFEQIAIIAQEQLSTRFPQIAHATSVEVWAHKRPADGQHQLHYDMDEVLLHTVLMGDDCDHKRQKIQSQSGPAKSSDIYRCISCPAVSCVITISPGASAAPTLICNQSITKHCGYETNCGWLCYPAPNRLIAFEGSLLHGVMPGIPSANSSEGDRVTLMLGFWNKTVHLTQTQDSSIGPNLPFVVTKTNEWTSEFNAVQMNKGFSFAKASEASPINAIETIDPLWNGTELSSSDDESIAFGEYRRSGEKQRFSGRFFLETKRTAQIDSEILHRNCVD